MPSTNLHPAFLNIGSFQDFSDAYRSHFGSCGVNDLRRAWNLLSTIVRNGNAASRIVALQYTDINVSQSSMRTAGSTLNRIFRNMGILVGRMTVSNADLHYATLDTSALDIAALDTSFVNALQSGLVAFRGRGQDRTTSRHVAGHRRANAIQRRAQAVSRSVSTTVSQVASAFTSISAAMPDFNPFDGITEDIFDILRAEAEIV